MKLNCGSEFYKILFIITHNIKNTEAISPNSQTIKAVTLHGRISMAT